MLIIAVTENSINFSTKYSKTAAPMLALFAPINPWSLQVSRRSPRTLILFCVLSHVFGRCKWNFDKTDKWQISCNINKTSSLMICIHYEWNRMQECKFGGRCNIDMILLRPHVTSTLLFVIVIRKWTHSSVFLIVIYFLFTLKMHLIMCAQTQLFYYIYIHFSR